MEDQFKTITMNEVLNYNRNFNPRYASSEESRYDINGMREFIERIRPTYTYTEVPGVDNKWREIRIKQESTKYGKRLFVCDEAKLWRTKVTMQEFYRGGPVYD